MNPRIETLKEKKLIGQCIKMSLADNRTGQLWGQFVPRIKEIKNKTTEDKISMQVYPPLYYKEFSPANEFEKWATIEVDVVDIIPEGMKSFILKGGIYAVFDYKGASSDHSIFHYIFSEWIPTSDYFIDDRPHFEVLGSKYKNNDPSSEEEIWVPIKKRASSNNLESA